MILAYKPESEVPSLGYWLREAQWPPTDTSLPILERLLTEGYDQVTWQTNLGASDLPCTMLNNVQWSLTDFITGTAYGAPIFSKSHVGCKCSIIVEGPGLTALEIRAY